MVMAGENAADDVDEEFHGNDGAERHEAREAPAADRKAIADADQAGHLDISGDATTARTQRTPEPPTDAAKMAHNVIHVPFRDWCPILCCESRTMFSAQTSCGEQDGGYSAEISDRLHVHWNCGRELNSAVHHIRGNAQWSGDQLHVRPER